jgi:hypothetical protein
MTAVFAVFIAVTIRRSMIQKEARLWLTSVRGDYTFEHKVKRSRDIFAPRDSNSPRVFLVTHNAKNLLFPQWFVSLLGPDLFTTVRSATVDTRDTTDLRPLAKLPYLRSLSISMSSAEDLDFAILKELPSLERVTLKGIDGNHPAVANLRLLLPQTQIHTIPITY